MYVYPGQFFKSQETPTCKFRLKGHVRLSKVVE